jgi:hypothetical protein
LLEIERYNCAFYSGRQHNQRSQFEIAKKQKANFLNYNDLKKWGMGDTGFEPVTSTV